MKITYEAIVFCLFCPFIDYRGVFDFVRGKNKQLFFLPLFFNASI